MTWCGESTRAHAPDSTHARAASCGARGSVPAAHGIAPGAGRRAPPHAGARVRACYFFASSVMALMAASVPASSVCPAG